MSGEMLTGQAAPASGEVASGEAAHLNAATAQPQTDGGKGGEGSNPEVPATKTFTQKEVDDIVKRAKAASESKAERRVLRMVERMLPQQQSQPQTPQQTQQRADDAGLTRKEGESEADFVRRVVKAERDNWEREQAQAKEQERAETLGKKTTSLYAEAEKLGDDFDRDEFDAHLTRPIAEALVESEDAARLMHYLGAHSDEMQRIAQLSPARQAAELGKLEAKLATDSSAKPTPPQRSNAPQALAPVRGAAKGGAPDPSDSAAWIRHQNALEAKRLRGN